jgi:hypothetical protein
MTFHARPAIAAAPRPWISRRDGECAFPVGDAEGMETLSCCNPSGEERYCAPHAAAMRGPRTSAAGDFERELIAYLERVERRR